MHGVRVRKPQLDDPDAGTVIETAILIPVLLLLIFGIIQTALFYNARNVASTAAQAAVRFAAPQNASAGQGQSAALQLIHDGAGNSLVDTSVKVSRGQDTVSVDVTGRVQSLIPFVNLPMIHAKAQGPVERVTR